jgi:membrane protein DedA with SNARE-associated domain
MPLGKFSLFTAVGTALWSFILAFAGRMLGENWHLVSDFIDKYENIVLVVVVLAFVYFIYTRWRAINRSKPEAEGERA